MKRTAMVLGVALLAGCGMMKPEEPLAPPEMVEKFTGRELYTCCNMHYQGDVITDANYTSGPIIPVGTPVNVQTVRVQSITFSAAGQQLTLRHLYGTEQESAEEYFSKIFVPQNRGMMVERMPGILKRTIQDGRVERGMKRGEVVLSLGFPPTDDNPSPESETWLYWHSKGNSYKVHFDANGYVRTIEGRPAPTNDKPVRVYESEL